MIQIRVVCKNTRLRDADEPVRRAGCVEVFSRDDAGRVDDRGERACGVRHIYGGNDGTVGRPEEAVTNEVRVVVRSRYGPAWVNTPDEGFRGPLRIEGSEGAVGSTHEAVSDEIRVVVKSRNSPRRVNRRGASANAVGDIEFGDATAGITHEAVKEEVRVTVPSHDGSGRINPLTGGTAYRVWSVEGSEAAVGSAQEPVRHAASIIIESCDCPRSVDALGDRECGAQWVEDGKGAIGRPHKAVTEMACVKICSGDGPGYVDGLATSLLKKTDIGTCRARRIDRREGAVARPQKGVKHRSTCSRNVGPCDCPRRVDAARQHVPGSAAQWIERNEDRMRVTQGRVAKTQGAIACAGSHHPRYREEHANAKKRVSENFCSHKMLLLSSDTISIKLTRNYAVCATS